MNTRSYRSFILLMGAAVLSLAGAGYASVDYSFPAAPALDVDAVHGVTALDRAALRSSSPDYGVSSPASGIVGPLLSLDPMEDHRKAQREGAWYIHEPAPSNRKLRPRISMAEVSLEGRTTRRCRRSGERHDCGEASWKYVGPTRLRIEGRDESCIWAHPISGSTIVIRYPSVLGGPYELEFALADRAIGTGTPVEVSIRFGEEEIAHRHPDRRGFTRVQLPASQEPTPLELRVSAANDGRRHFCYRIESK